jgi:hypothetical protein
MERTQPRQVDPSSLQRNELRDDVSYLRRIEDPFYGGVVDHGPVKLLKSLRSEGLKSEGLGNFLIFIVLYF